MSAVSSSGNVDVVDVVVVGVGALGAAALYHLARRGLRVVGIEQHGIAHDLGSSWGHSRIIRKAYFEEPRYIPLLQRAYQLWRTLEEESGASLMELRGVINIGPRSHPSMQTLVRGIEEHRLEHEVLQASAIRDRFPIFAPAEGDIGIFERDGGVLRPEACIRAHVELALRHGAHVVLRERVIDVKLGAHGGVISTEQGSRWAARHVVVCAGPWWPSMPFLRDIARPLVTTRQVQAWFPEPPTGGNNSTAAQMPGFIHFLRDGRAFYGLPPVDNTGIKVARHGGGARTTADTVDRAVHREDIDEVRTYLRVHMPTLDAAPRDAKVCMYTMTPDEHFIVGLHPQHPHVVVLGGTSGHGFKMASVLGEIAADLVQRRTTHYDITLFAPERFVPVGAESR